MTLVVTAVPRSTVRLAVHSLSWERATVRSRKVRAASPASVSGKRTSSVSSGFSVRLPVSWSDPLVAADGHVTTSASVAV
jgi:hypothetical protein